MLTRAVAVTILTAAAFVGCHGCFTADPKTSASRPAASLPEVIPLYSQENAQKLYHAGKY